MTEEQMQADWRWLQRQLRRATRGAVLGSVLAVIGVMVGGVVVARASALPAGVSMTSLLLLLVVAVPVALGVLGAVRGALWRRSVAGALPQLRERRQLNACAGSLPPEALEQLATPERRQVDGLLERERRGDQLSARDYARGLRVLLTVAPGAGRSGGVTRSASAAHRPAGHGAGQAADTGERRSPPPPR